MIHAVGTALGEIIQNLRRTVRLTLYENRSRRAGMLLGRWWDLLSPLLQVPPAPQQHPRPPRAVLVERQAHGSPQVLDDFAQRRANRVYHPPAASASPFR